MAIFYTDTGSLGQLEISGSGNILNVKGSGSNILVVSGSAGSLFQISDLSPNTNIFTIASGSTDVLSVGNSRDIYISGSLTVDVASFTDLLSPAGFIGNQNNYIEVYAQNLSSGVSASTDIVAYANNGSETSSFIDMGINSSGIGAGYSFGSGNDGYIYNTGGNLYIGNNTPFFQPAVTQSSIFLFSNASGSPDLTITGSRVGIRKSGSLNATLDVNGNAIITGSLNVTQGITGSLLGTASLALTASFALNAGGGSGFPFAGTALITGSVVLTSGSGFPSLLASETLTAGDIVNIFSGGVRRASSNDTTKQAHGFVTSSAVATNPVVVFYSGLNTNVSGLTIGARYFLSASGAESTIPPVATGQLSQEIGVAISATALLFQPGPAIIT
jgi:hypothetical protein